jgi:hypothetical protein
MSNEIRIRKDVSSLYPTHTFVFLNDTVISLHKDFTFNTNIFDRRSILVEITHYINFHILKNKIKQIITDVDFEPKSHVSLNEHYSELCTKIIPDAYFKIISKDVVHIGDKSFSIKVA